MSASRVPSEQRIFSLVLALVSAPVGLTKHALLSSVHGYSGRYRPGAPNDALERQFERDKEQLRSLGIPVETLDSPLEPGNNQLTRYRISKELLEFPAELRFSERELVLLRLAAIAWRDGSLSVDSRRAVMKLEALGAGLDVRHLGVAPSLGTAEPAAPQLQRAIDEGVVVRFEYLLPTRSEPLERRVAPLHLRRVEGRWHLLGWDLERDAGRVFLLSRITGSVRIEAIRGEPTRFDAVLRDRTAGILEDLEWYRSEHLSRLAVRAGSAAEARLGPRALPDDASAADLVDGAEQAEERAEGPGGPAGSAAGTVVLTLPTLDEHLLAEELVAYGSDVVVLDPPSLRDAVVARLSAILIAHGGSSRASAGAADPGAESRIPAREGER